MEVKRHIVKAEKINIGEVLLYRSRSYNDRYEYQKVVAVEIIDRIDRIVIAHGDRYSSTAENILTEGLDDSYIIVRQDQLFTIAESTREDKLDLIDKEDSDV